MYKWYNEYNSLGMISAVIVWCKMWKEREKPRIRKRNARREKKKREKGRIEKAALKQEERGDEDRLECQKNMYILYRIRCRERIDRAQPASSAGEMHRDALSVDLFWLRFPYRLWRTMETTGELLNVSLFLIYLRSLKLFEW